MNMQKRLRGMILGVTVLFMAFWVYADDVTISTFYPSPYGSYKNLDSTDETHLATDAGKVGIGTTAPQGKLHVAGATTMNAFLSDGNDRPQIGITGNHPALILWGQIGNSAHGPAIMMGSKNSGDAGSKHWSLGTSSQDSTFFGYWLFGGK